jgi:catechol 2,3-dioxygenase-like lactoylglutathione lyase family enzyme
MSPPRIRPTQIHHVALRVRDLERSTAFYRDLFGLEPKPMVPPGDDVRICAAPSARAGSSFGIVLIQGLPSGTQPIGMDHLSLEVPSAEDVEDIYATALSHGAAATEPRVYGGFYQTYVFDPDEHKVEVVTRELPSAPGVRVSVGGVARTRPVRSATSSRDAFSRGETTARPPIDSGGWRDNAEQTGR